MKKVVISGYYGFDNAGDEALLGGMLCALREEAAARGKEISCTVLSARPALTAARYGVSAVGRTGLWQIVSSLLSCDLFISGGGSLLQDTTGLKLSVAYYLGLALLARMMGKPVILYAHGIGPIHKKINRLLVRLIAGRVTRITVRDAASLALLKDMGVARPPVELTADPAFLLKPRKAPDLPVFARGTPVVGVAARPWQGQKRYLEEMAAAAAILADDNNAGILLIPMHYSEDLPVLRRMAKKLGPKAAVLEQCLEPAQLLDIFSRLELVLSVRLHALIFAAAAGVPMVGIGYDPKVDGFMRRLGLETAGNILEVSAAELVRQGRERRLNRQSVRESLGQKGGELRAQARQAVRDIADILFESGERP